MLNKAKCCVGNTFSFMYANFDPKNIFIDGGGAHFYFIDLYIHCVYSFHIIRTQTFLFFNYMEIVCTPSDKIKCDSHVAHVSHHHHFIMSHTELYQKMWHKEHVYEIS